MIHHLLQLFAAPIKIDPSKTGVPAVDINAKTLDVALTATFIVVGAIGVLFLVIGAIRYQIANGDQGQLSRAKDTILYAIVGIILTLLAFGIVRVILGIF